MNWIQPKGRNVELRIAVVANSKQSQIIGIVGQDLKIKIHAPPVDGKANLAIIEFLSEILNLPKSRFEILKGSLSKKKTILISDINPNEIRVRLGI